MYSSSLLPDFSSWNYFVCLLTTGLKLSIFGFYLNCFKYIGLLGPFGFFALEADKTFGYPTRYLSEICDSFLFVLIISHSEPSQLKFGGIFFTFGEGVNLEAGLVTLTFFPCLTLASFFSPNTFPMESRELYLVLVLETAARLANRTFLGSLSC